MEIVLYSTGCPKCRVLEAALNSKKIAYKLIQNEDDIIERGFTSVPVLKVDSKIMKFPEAIEWVNER